jgi:hypothetical protein
MKFAPDVVSFFTCLTGVASLKDSLFNPLVFFFYFAGIVIVAVIMGYLTEVGIDKIKNRKKSNEMGMGSRHL